MIVIKHQVQFIKNITGIVEIIILIFNLILKLWPNLYLKLQSPAIGFLY